MKTSYLLLALCFAAFSANSQDRGPSNISSGTGSGMNTVKNNLTDGSVDIAVPIYTYSDADITIPIELTYNTKGIRIDDIASSVGIGWQLSVGASITRNVRGFPDEKYSPSYNLVDGTNSGTRPGRRGFWLTSAAIDADYLAGSSGSSFLISDYNRDDYEADQFYLTLPDKSVTFYISKNGTVVTSPKTNIIIERTVNGALVSNSSAFPQDLNLDLGFVVTDEQGNKFYFSKGNMQSVKELKEKEYNTNTSDWDYEYYDATEIADWVLSKVLTYQGKIIDYKYSFSQVTYQSGKNETLVYHEQKKAWNSLAFLIPTSFNGTVIRRPHTLKVNEPVIWSGYAVRLDKVLFPTEEQVSFTYDFTNRTDIYGGQTLNSITQQATANTMLSLVGKFPKKIFKLTHSYFYSNENLNLLESVPLANSISFDQEVSKKYRLKLDKIEILDENNLNLGSYDFIYDYSYLPPRFDNRKDHFGYYNGNDFTQVPVPVTPPPDGWTNPSTMNVTLGVPKVATVKFEVDNNANFSTSTSYYGTNKTPNIAYAIGGSLKSYTTPLKKKTSFYYKSHVLKDVLSKVNNTVEVDYHELSDGLCIDKIKIEDGYNHENDVETRFDYHDADPIYCGQSLLPDNFSTYSYDYKFNIDNSYYDKLFYLTNNSLTGYLNGIGSNHSYTKVTVSAYNYYGSLNSKVDYLFTNAVNLSQNGTTISASNFAYIDFPSPLTNTSVSQNFYQKHYTSPHTNKQYIYEWMIGLPLETTAFDMNNIMVGKTINEYNYYNTNVTSTDFLSMNYLNVGLTINSTYNYIVHKDFYYPVTGYSNLKKTTEYQYLQVGNTSEKAVDYEYNNNNDLKKTKFTNSYGNLIEDIFYYNYDFSISQLANLNQSNAHKIVLQETWLNKAGLKYLLKAKGYGFQDITNNIQYDIVSNTSNPSKTFTIVNGYYESALTNPLPTSSYLSGSFDISTASSGGNIPFFVRQTRNNNFSVDGKVLETNNMDGIDEAYVWDVKNGEILATIRGAKYDEIAYSSFESSAYNLTENKGNIAFNVGSIKSYGNCTLSHPGVTGYCSYKLSSGDGLTTTGHLVQGKKYIVSFWINNGYASANDGTNVIPTLNTGPTIRGWTLKWAEFTYNGNGTMQIWGDSYIDEVRVYPASAQMTSSCFYPLTGLNTVCGPNNTIEFYETDALGTVKTLRDQNDNIIIKKSMSIQKND